MVRSFSLGDVRRGGLLAMAAALLFGLSTPAAKAIIGNVQPLLLAGLLYLGSGFGLLVIIVLGYRHGARLKRADAPWLAATILFGGALGPALLMVGLTQIAGSAASLLLTLEGVFTALIAWMLFQEPFNRRIGTGIAAILAGAILLALRAPSGHAGLLGTLAVAGACLSWAIDNNCTSKIADVDALTLASIKGGAAGAVNVGLALITGSHFPTIGLVGASALVGFFGYGLSLVLFVVALREVGAARTGAYFSTAPFIGAAVGLVVLNEPFSLNLVFAGMLMGIGVYLHLTEPSHGGGSERSFTLEPAIKSKVDPEVSSHAASDSYLEAGAISQRP